MASEPQEQFDVNGTKITTGAKVFLLSGTELPDDVVVPTELLTVKNVLRTPIQGGKSVQICFNFKSIGGQFFTYFNPSDVHVCVPGPQQPEPQ